MSDDPDRARIAHGGDVHWFSGYQPGAVDGACPHGRCPHNTVGVIAWGPTFGRYELVQCDVRGDVGCRGGCRAWIDHRARITTAWLAVRDGTIHAAPAESRKRTPTTTRSGAE
jgi:hypothetical protein